MDGGRYGTTKHIPTGRTRARRGGTGRDAWALVSRWIWDDMVSDEGYLYIYIYITFEDLSTYSRSLA